jgi:hypothetical protein
MSISPNGPEARQGCGLILISSSTSIAGIPIASWVSGYWTTCPPMPSNNSGSGGEGFGVTHGLAPHPDERLFKRWQEGGTDKTKG